MQSYKINPAHIMAEVYSYPFPEVRNLIDQSRLPAAFMLNTLPVATAQEYLKSYSFTPELNLPSTDDVLNLDELHIPVIDRIARQLEVLLPGIKGFDHSYPCHGSSQAMYTLMAEWKAGGEMTSLAVLESEYEGYAANAKSLNIPVTVYTSLAHHQPKAGEVWFVSNPSAVDGNFIEAKMWRDFMAAGHQIVYDAAYIGLVTEGRVDVSAPNIRAVLTSPSKVFGVFRYRNTGVCFTRQSVTALYGTKWFKDIPALLDTLRLYETFAPYELPQRYRPVQEALCQQLSRETGTVVLPSDTLLLAHAAKVAQPSFRQYKRGRGYRFGLTKLFEDYEFSLEATSSR